MENAMLTTEWRWADELSQSAQSGQQGVYAQAGELTAAEARRMIANAQNPHPGVMPGYDAPYPVEAEALGRAYRQTAEALALGAAGVVAPEAVAGARGMATAARTPFGRALVRDFSNNLVLGFGEGHALAARTGPVGFTPAARLGFELGYAAGLSQSRLATGIRALLGQ